MENCRFAMHWQPKFTPTKTITLLCDNLTTTTVEPNYSPNWGSNTRFPNPLPCTSYTTDAPVGAGVVYVVVADAGSEGVAAVSFGIDYHGGSSTPTNTGIDPQFVTWTPCADGVSFPNSDGVHGLFPQPGGGLRITWDSATSCQREIIGSDGVHAVVGVFYVYAYSSDVLRVTPNNNLQGGPELAIANWLAPMAEARECISMDRSAKVHAAARLPAAPATRRSLSHRHC
jgi:hypothetical protein